MRQNSTQKLENASYLRLEDFSEQFESVPIRISVFSFVFSIMKLAKLLIHSMNSSSFLLAGKYTEIARSEHEDVELIQTPVIRSFVAGMFFMKVWMVECQPIAQPCQVWSGVLSLSSGCMNMSGVEI